MIKEKLRNNIEEIKVVYNKFCEECMESCKQNKVTVVYCPSYKRKTND